MLRLPGCLSGALRRAGAVPVRGGERWSITRRSRLGGVQHCLAALRPEPERRAALGRSFRCSPWPGRLDCCCCGVRCSDGGSKPALRSCRAGPLGPSRRGQLPDTGNTTCGRMWPQGGFGVGSLTNLAMWADVRAWAGICALAGTGWWSGSNATRERNRAHGRAWTVHVCAARCIRCA